MTLNGYASGFWLPYQVQDKLRQNDMLGGRALPAGMSEYWIPAFAGMTIGRRE